MKTLLISLFFISSLTSTYASPAKAEVIAESSSIGGFILVTSPFIRSVQILRDGTLQYYQEYRDGRIEIETLGSLEPRIIHKILEEVADFGESDLVFVDPDEPMCADAPDLVYRARNAQGQLVNLGGESACKEQQRADKKYTPVADALQSLQRLSWLVSDD